MLSYDLTMAVKILNLEAKTAEHITQKTKKISKLFFIMFLSLGQLI